MKTEITRYVAQVADTTRSIYLSQRMGRILVTDGPTTSPKTDRRYVREAVAIVTSSTGDIRSGLALSIATLTGHTGDTWIIELESGTQGAGSLVRLGRSLPLEYGVGVLIRLGGLTTGDIVQIGSVYD